MGDSDRRYLLPKWLAVIICDAVGAVVGNAVGGPVGAVILGAGASIEAGKASNIPSQPSIDNAGMDHNDALVYITRANPISTEETFALAGKFLVEKYGVKHVESEVKRAVSIFKKSQSDMYGEAIAVDDRPKAMLSFSLENGIVSKALHEALLDIIDAAREGSAIDAAFEKAERQRRWNEDEQEAMKIGKDVAKNSEKYWQSKMDSDRRYLLPKWLAVIICDAVGAVVGYAVGGPVGAVILGAGASIEAGKAFR